MSDRQLDPEFHTRAAQESLRLGFWCWQHDTIRFFCDDRHENHRSNTMAQDVNLPALIVDRLAPEGSDLLIQKANSDNLDWTWRVTHHNGTTGQSTTYTGSDLPEVFSKFNRFGFNGTNARKW